MSTFDEIRDTLKDILVEMKYHTKLLEGVFENFDGRRHESVETSQKMLDAIRSNLLSHPSIQSNPDILKRMESIINIIPGGDKQ